MTTLPRSTTAATPPQAGPVTTGWRRHRSTLLIVGALLAALALVVLTQGPVTRAADLDPDNPGPGGAQAVARVLDDQGVVVEVVRSAPALGTTALDADSLVVVTSSSDLGTSTTRALLDQVASAGAGLVVVDPGVRLLDTLAIDGGPTRIDVGDGVPGSCDDTTYDDLVLVVDGADAMPLDGCFSDALAAQDTIGGDLTLLGAGQLLSNDQVLRGDNAAIALRLLGGRERLVWYVASPDDLVADDGIGITSLLPDWIFPGLAILLLSTVLLVLWRGRRLGPLASEPLPVVVKAIETTRSRGRLYRRSGDLAHAADALRAATRSRTGARLRLGAHVADTVVVDAVARHVGRPESEIATLIGAGAHAPASDRDLIVLANDLAALEEEVRRA